MQLFLGGVWRTISSAKVFLSGSWRDVVQGKEYNGGSWRTILNFTPPAPSGGSGGGGAISLTVSPNPVRGRGSSAPVTTAVCTVTPSGGLAPYTYRWSLISGACTINSPSSASTSFTDSTVADGSSDSATATCLVKDSLGVTASISVDISFTNTGGLQ